MIKSLIYCTVFFLSYSTCASQANSKKQPLILRGQIKNCPVSELIIIYWSDGPNLTDSIHLDSSGNFSLKTFKVKKPQVASLRNNGIQINNLFVAPGFDLNIIATYKAGHALSEGLTISGIGAQSNRFRMILDSINLLRTKRTWELKQNEFLSAIENNRKLADSVAELVFEKKKVNEIHFDQFKKMVSLDNNFQKLISLLSYINVNDYQFNYENSLSFVQKNFDNKMLQHLINDNYLVSERYRTLIRSEWPTYIANLDFKKDSNLRKLENYKFNKAITQYSGNIKEYYVYQSLYDRIVFSQSLEELYNKVEKMQTDLGYCENEIYKKDIESVIGQKEYELSMLQVGKPARAFNLKSNNGIYYSLNDLKGKVIYIDFWASWCTACREETQYLKQLYSSYKDEKEIVFISIAVHDVFDDWKKALKEDQPEWIQLFDDKEIWRFYGATLLPRFVLVGKDGNIVSINAPRPSSISEVESILNEQSKKAY